MEANPIHSSLLPPVPLPAIISPSHNNTTFSPATPARLCLYRSSLLDGAGHIRPHLDLYGPGESHWTTTGQCCSKQYTKYNELYHE